MFKAPLFLPLGTDFLPLLLKRLFFQYHPFLGMDQFPELHTERLHLRKLGVDDVYALIKYANNYNVSDNILNMKYPFDEPAAMFRLAYVLQGFKAKTRYVFAIISKKHRELIGEISLHLSDDRKKAELGYWVGEPLWNNGYTSEAVAVVVRFGFQELNLNLIAASWSEENPASGRVLEKNGFSMTAYTGTICHHAINRQYWLHTRQQ